MNLQPCEFIATLDSNPQRIAAYSMVPGPVVRLGNRIFVSVDVSKGLHWWVGAKTGCGPDAG